jgi:hypothetical protein
MTLLDRIEAKIDELEDDNSALHASLMFDISNWQYKLNSTSLCTNEGILDVLRELRDTHIKENR